MKFEMTHQKLSNYVAPGLFTIVFIFSFLPVIEKLQIRWESGDDSYCYLMVPLFLYLCWEKREQFRFDSFSWNNCRGLPLILSVLTILFGELGSVETLLYTGVWGCIASTLFLLYGFRLKQLIFPLLVLAFLVPMPPFINRMLTFHMKLAASSLSVVMMRMFGVTVLREGNVIDIGVQQLQVVDACSGLRYFVPLILLALLVGYFFNRRIWTRVALLLIAPPLSVLVNGVRIFATAMLILGGHPELAENFFHDFSGWLVFMVAGSILFGASQLLKRLNRSAPEPSEKREALPPPPLFGGTRPSAGAIVTICLLFVGSGWALRAIPDSLILPDRSKFESFPMSIGDWNGKRGVLSQDILDQLWADDYVTATFHHASQGNRLFLLIPYYEYQGTRHTAHAPQSCLLGGGWDLLQTQDLPLNTGNGQFHRIRTMLLQKGDNRMLGSYFFLQRGRVVLSPWMNKLYLIWDAMTQRRTDGALVRVELLLSPGQSLEEGRRLLSGFIADLWKLLPAYVPK